MKTRIKRDDIVGAQIVAIHGVSEKLHRDLVSTHVYFTVNRGFTFRLPIPGFTWWTDALPANVPEFADEFLSRTYDSSTFFGREVVMDQVRQIKARTICGVFCEPLNQDEEYGPDDAMIIFHDGARAWVRTVEPDGIPTGLFFRQPDDDPHAISRLVDLFEIPCVTQ